MAGGVNDAQLAVAEGEAIVLFTIPMNIVGKLPKTEISSRNRSMVLLNHSRARSAMASELASVTGSLTPPGTIHAVGKALLSRVEDFETQKAGAVRPAQ
jgi:hypothetical protein